MGEYQADASGNYNLSSEAENTVGKDVCLNFCCLQSMCTL